MSDIFLFFLDSGITANPYVILASVFFAIACVISMIACRTLEKGSEKKNHLMVVYVVLILISIGIAFHLILKGSAEIKEDASLQDSEVENTRSFLKSIEL